MGCAEAGGIDAAGVCGWEASGTCTIALHCGQEARRPAAEAGTFSDRPQPEQWNSMVPSEAAVGWDMISLQMTNDK